MKAAAGRGRAAESAPQGATPRQDPPGPLTWSATVIFPMSRSNSRGSAIAAGQSNRDACPMLFRTTHLPCNGQIDPSARAADHPLDTVVEADKTELRRSSPQ